MKKNIFPVKVEGTQLNNKEHEMYVLQTSRNMHLI